MTHAEHAVSIRFSLSEGILKVRPIWVKTLKARLAVDLGQNDKSGPARGKMVKVAPPQARENFGHSTLRRMPLAPPSRQMVPRQLQPSQRVKCCGRMRPYVSQTCSATCLDTHRRALSRGERQHFFSHSVRELLCRCGTIGIASTCCTRGAQRRRNF